MLAIRGLTEAGKDGVGGHMIRKNKNATVVRPLLRPASNYTHTDTHIRGLPIWPSGCR